MIRSIRNLQMLIALVLLLSGVHQSLAYANGQCGVDHSLAETAAYIAASDGDDSGDSGSDHEHLHWFDGDQEPEPSAPSMGTAVSCGAAIVASNTVAISAAVTADHLVPRDGLPPTSSLANRLFRPPRLS